MSTKFQQIKVYNLTKKYNKEYVFIKFNTTITNEKINLLVGYNGKGKSTFLKILLNLISYEGIIEKTFKSVAYCPDKVKLPDFIKENYIPDGLHPIDNGNRVIAEKLKTFLQSL